MGFIIDWALPWRGWKARSRSNAVLDRFSDLRLERPDAELKYKGSYFLRALAELPMLTG
jgi:hypothetical protein